MYCSHRKIASHLLFTPQGLIPSAVVSLDKQGQVVKIEQCKSLDAMAGVEFYAGILVAPMTNAHCHIELSYLRGAIPPGGGFASFAASIGKLKGRASKSEQIASAQYWDAKMYAQGVGKVLDISNSTTSFEVKRQSKIIYHTFAELFGLGTTSLEPLDELISCKEGLDVHITPHSTYSLNDEAFKMAVGGSAYAPLSIHFMESQAEQELYSRTGPLWQWYKANDMSVDFLHYGSPTKRIIESIQADRDIYLVHNTFLSREDALELMSHFGTRVTFVLCPASNLFIEGSLPNVHMLTELGAKIALGTDSLASSENLSLVGAMACFEHTPLGQMLQWVDGAVEIGTQGLVLIENIDMTQLRITEKSTSRRLA